MSARFSASDLRDLILKLERLEEWQKQVESDQRSQSEPSGYRRGDPRSRATALWPVEPKPAFPAIPQIARLWKCMEEGGPPFEGEAFGSIEDGPGPIPALLEEQAIAGEWSQKEALQRVHCAYSSGFWGRASLETFTDQVFLETPSAAQHFIVLRACGLGGFVRFASQSHFNRFRDQVFAGGFVSQGFTTFKELEVYCRGARIAVPPLFEPC